MEFHVGQRVRISTSSLSTQIQRLCGFEPGRTYQLARSFGDVHVLREIVTHGIGPTLPCMVNTCHLRPVDLPLDPDLQEPDPWTNSSPSAPG